MAIFDEDEENPPIYFEQDPESDDLGDGYWTRKDGSRVYSAGDPALARDLMDKGKGKLAEAGAKMAGAAPALPSGAPLSDDERGSLEASPEELSRLGGEASGIGPSQDEQFLAMQTGAERDAEQEAMGGAAPEAPAAPAQPGGEAAQQAKPLQQGLQAPALPGARGPARYTDTGSTSAQQSQSLSNQSSVSRTGSAQDRGEFERQQGAVAGSYDQANQATREGAQGMADAARQRAAALAQMGADKEAAAAGAMASRDQRANQVKQKIGEVSSRKTDHNKIWKDKGALGTTLGLLGVALRSLNATKFGGPNTALQSLQEQRKQNIQAQMEDRDSELRGLERELGSLDAAVPMLEARMRDAENKRIEGMLANEKSAEVVANGQKMIAQNNIERDKFLAESAKNYAGTLAQQQSQALQQSQSVGQEMQRSRLSGAGVGETGAQGKTREQMFDDLLERDKKMEERGIPKEERAQMWAQYGFRAPSSESAPEMTNREQREKVARDEANFSEDQAKAESAMAMLEDQATKSGIRRDPKTGKWVEPGGIEGTGVPGWSEGVGELFGQSTPVRDSRELATEAFGRLASGGVISKDEGDRFAEFFGNGKATRNQLASKLNALETLVNTRRKANRREAPRAVPDSWRKKSEETQP